MQIRAVGFDLGETLVTYRDAPLNWASLYRPALTRVAETLGLEIQEPGFADAERVLRHYNTRLNARTKEVAADEIFLQIFSCWGLSGFRQIPDAVAAFFDFFRQSLRVYDDALPALRQLREAGIRVGVLTDVPYGMPKSLVERDLIETGVRSWIDVVLTSVEVGARKPSPAGFQQLAERLNVQPHEMLYVGNEPKDIDGANTAGMTSVSLERDLPGPGEYRARWPEANAVISQLTELKQLLR